MLENLLFINNHIFSTGIQQSTINNQQSTINNLQSPISNLQSQINAIRFISYLNIFYSIFTTTWAVMMILIR